MDDRATQHSALTTERSRVRVVIPMKPLEASKGRLARTLDPWRRALLSLWMLERVVVAAQGATTVGEVVVVGGDAAIEALCEERRARWEPDVAADLDGALELARRASCERGWQAMLFLAGDLPRLRADEVAALASDLDGEGLVLGPARRGGTNAIRVSCALAFHFQMGPDSFRRHQRQARLSGAAWRAFHSPGVVADVDLPTDLAWLERAQPDVWRLAAGMARFLAARDVPMVGIP